MGFDHIAWTGAAQLGALVQRAHTEWSLADTGGWYQREIVAPGKQPLLFLLLALICAFLLTRFSTRMIRRRVRWWPGNVTHGDVHVHHVVFGTCAMVAGGIGSFACGGESPGIDLAAVLFGMGTALVLDEFALILHLEDVYWSEEGRTSIDAVILATVVTFLVLLGFSPLGINRIDDAEAVLRWLAIAHALAVFWFAAICFLKGKLWTGVLGMLVSPIAMAGAIRLAQPDSPWARWFYGDHSKRRAAFIRAEMHHRRWTTRKHRVWDLIGGSPTERSTWNARTDALPRSPVLRPGTELPVGDGRLTRGDGSGSSSQRDPGVAGAATVSAGPVE